MGRPKLIKNRDRDDNRYIGLCGICGYPIYDGDTINKCEYGIIRKVEPSNSSPNGYYIEIESYDNDSEFLDIVHDTCFDSQIDGG